MEKRKVIKSAYFGILSLLAVVFILFGSKFLFERNARKELLQVCNTKLLEFDVGFKDQLALGIQMSKSPLIVSYMENPEDEILKEQAFSEVKAYQESFSSKQTFMINDRDLIYHINCKPQYELDKSDPSSAWYVATSRMTKDYDLFVDYEKALKATFAWVNAIVRDKNRNFLGLIGTGIPVSDFVDTMYKTLPSDVVMYLYNSNMEVSGALDHSLMGSGKSIKDVVPVLAERAENEIKPENIQFFTDGFTVYAVSSVPAVGWYNLVYKSFSIGEFFSNAVLPFSIVMIVVFLNISILLLRRILNPLKLLTRAANHLSSGEADLARRIDVDRAHSLKILTNLCDGFNMFIQKVQEIIKSVKDSKENLVDNGLELRSCSQDTSSSISQILQSIDSLDSTIIAQTETVHETALAVNKISENIHCLDGLIDSQSSSVEKATDSIQQMIKSIDGVNSSVIELEGSFDQLGKNAHTGIEKQNEVNRKLSDIQSQSQMLQDANTVISSIAEQTNLLAMNAAIEAAHAGEAGKGFSVVADEIRSLAETSSEQSRTIGQQLLAIQNSISEIVNVSEETQTSFDNVSDGIQCTNQIIQKISAAMRMQESDSKNINSALELLNDSTSQVKSSSSEMTEDSTLILSKMENLQSSTGNMKTGMDEMNLSARKINDTERALSSLAGKIEESISEISVQMEKFKV